MAIARVAARVTQHGHNVEKEVIQKRFTAGWHNFQYTHKGLVDAWILYDNALDSPRYLDSGEKQP